MEIVRGCFGVDSESQVVRDPAGLSPTRLVPCTSVAAAISSSLRSIVEFVPRAVVVAGDRSDASPPSQGGGGGGDATMMPSRNEAYRRRISARASASARRARPLSIMGCWTAAFDDVAGDGADDDELPAW